MDNVKVFDGCKHPIKHLKNDNIFIVLTPEEKELLFKGSGNITIDTSLNKNSINPVLNKVLYNVILDLYNKIEKLTELIESGEIPTEEDPEGSIVNGKLILDTTISGRTLVINAKVNNNTLIL